jgi:hypothetical protein
MKTSEKTNNEKRIVVAFHVSGGGGNRRRVDFIGEKEINCFTDDLFLNIPNAENIVEKALENSGLEADEQHHVNQSNVSISNVDHIAELVSEKKYAELEKYGINESDFQESEFFDGGGNSTGLTESEGESGIGTIDRDGDYDTTTSCYLDECSVEECEIIEASNEWKSQELQAFVNEKNS